MKSVIVCESRIGDTPRMLAATPAPSAPTPPSPTPPAPAMLGVRSAAAISAVAAARWLPGPTRAQPVRLYSILTRVEGYGGAPAVVDATGTHSYAAVSSSAQKLAGRLVAACGAAKGAASATVAADGRQHRIAFACPRDRSWVEAMWATWYAGGIAVPLAESYPTEEVKYVLQDAGEWG